MHSAQADDANAAYLLIHGTIFAWYNAQSHIREATFDQLDENLVSYETSGGLWKG